MNTVEILKAARQLISDEKRWTQGDYCRVNGRPIKGNGSDRVPENAECFCAIGSIAAAADFNIREAEDSKAFKVLYQLCGDECGVHEFNDTHTHAEVLDLFDRAIARAESEAA